jgi:hypothetical protein
MYQGIPFDGDTPQPMFEAKWDVTPIKVVAQADYENLDAVHLEQSAAQARVGIALAAELQASRIETAHHSRVSAGLQLRAELAESRATALAALLHDIYAVKPPGDDEWCTQPWSDLCDRICELVPDVMTEDDHG